MIIESGKENHANETIKSQDHASSRRIEKRTHTRTPSGRKLWAYLRGDKLNGVNFRRQHAISNFIPDFFSIKRRLIIELDGSQHLKQAEYDIERSKYFESLGYKVIRFWNNQVENDVNGVIRTIELALSDV